MKYFEGMLLIAIFLRLVLYNLAYNGFEMNKMIILDINFQIIKIIIQLL